LTVVFLMGRSAQWIEYHPVASGVNDRKGAMMLTPEDLQELAAQLDATELDELEVQVRGMTVVLRRHGAGGWTRESIVTRHPHVFGEPVPEPTAPGRPPQVSVGEPAAPAEAAGESSGDRLRVALYPPLLGTFYRAPNPEADAFVEPGARVEPDTVVGIIETMKMMNSVPAGVAGTVVEIVAANGEFADSTDVLMWIEVDQ